MKEVDLKDIPCKGQVVTWLSLGLDLTSVIMLYNKWPFKSQWLTSKTLVFLAHKSVGWLRFSWSWLDSAGQGSKLQVYFGPASYISFGVGHYLGHGLFMVMIKTQEANSNQASTLEASVTLFSLTFYCPKQVIWPS